MFDFLKRKKKHKPKGKSVSERRMILMQQLSKAGGKPIFRKEDVKEVWSKIIETRNISETARQLNCSYGTIRTFIRKHACPLELMPRDVD